MERSLSEEGLVVLLVAALTRGKKIVNDGRTYSIGPKGNLVCLVPVSPEGDPVPVIMDYDLKALSALAERVGRDELVKMVSPV